MNTQDVHNLIQNKKDISKMSDRTKYCAFNPDIRQNITGYFNVKEAIEALIRSGKVVRGSKLMVSGDIQEEKCNPHHATSFGRRI